MSDKTLDWMKRPHRRLNPLTGQWVLVSPQRLQRPWQGEVGPAKPLASLAYDPQCYLCPGNERAGGVRNPNYASTFIFDNDFPALLPQTLAGSLNQNDVLIAAPEKGVCRVMCFSPRHDVSVPTLDLDSLTAVVLTWCTESAALRRLPFVRYVQIFENRGAMMGASNPHPHCQIWAVEHIPEELVKEDDNQRDYAVTHGACLLCDYLGLESKVPLADSRVVFENGSFLAAVPFWAVWPFEIIVLPKRHCDRLEEMTPPERGELGIILREVTSRFDALFGTAFPYSMGFHERPVDGSAPPEAWHFHAHFYPPLLRSATVRKYMVGFELLAGPQRDITAEQAARAIRQAIPLQTKS